MTQSYTRVGPGPASTPATIPISIRHGKLHMQGRINGSTLLDLIFDTGADTNVLYPSGIRKGAGGRVDGTTTNSGTGGSTVRKSGRGNRLEVAELRWDHQAVTYVEKQADAADGIVGYPVFEGKVVEIDYDRMIMSIGDSLPRDTDRFTRTAMAFSGSLTAVEAILLNGERRTSGLFSLDTGGTGTLMINRAFADAHGLRAAMRRLGTSRSSGVGSGVVHNEVMLLPGLMIAGIEISNVPVHVEFPSANTKASLDGLSCGGSLCMDVLSRINTILDYSRYEAYFRPTRRVNAPFRQGIRGAPGFAIAGFIVVVVALIAGKALRRRRAED